MGAGGGGGLSVSNKTGRAAIRLSLLSSLPAGRKGRSRRFAQEAALASIRAGRVIQRKCWQNEDLLRFLRFCFSQVNAYSYYGIKSYSIHKNIHISSYLLARGVRLGSFYI